MSGVGGVGARTSQEGFGWGPPLPGNMESAYALMYALPTLSGKPLG